MLEQSIQSKLQHLNYEVYCSTNVIEKLKSRSFTQQFLIQFPIIILSETIPNLEIPDILKHSPRGLCTIVRKDTIIPSKDLLEEWKEIGINEYISSEISSNHLREKMTELQTLIQKERRKFNSNYTEKNLDLFKTTLSGKSKDFFLALYKANRSFVSREEMCQLLWREPSTPSHLSQISSIVKRIEIKFSQAFNISNAIQTGWGQGYRLSEELLDLLDEFE